MPDYLRRYFAVTVPIIERGESQTPDDEDNTQYPYEGDAVFGCEIGPDSYKFTYHADEEDYHGSLHLKLRLDDMRSIASGDQKFLELWKCDAEECDRWVQDPMERCLNCEFRLAEEARKAAIPSKPPPTSASSAYPPRVEIAGPPAEFFGELKAFNVVGCPSIANLLGMSREEAESTVLARSDDGRMVRDFYFGDDGARIHTGHTKFCLEYEKGRGTPGGVAWDAAALMASWGTQNRLEYAPERPIRCVHGYRIRRVSCDGDYWRVSWVNDERAALYNASANRAW